MNSKLNLIDDLTNLESCLVKFDQPCSYKILKLKIGMKRDKAILRYLKRHLTKMMAFGLNDRIPILQILFKSRSARPESLSFLGLFEDKYKYLQLLFVKSEIHMLWIERYVKRLQRNSGDLKRKSRAFYEEFKQSVFSNISKIFDSFDENIQALRNITMNMEKIPSY